MLLRIHLILALSLLACTSEPRKPPTGSPGDDDTQDDDTDTDEGPSSSDRDANDQGSGEDDDDDVPSPTTGKDGGAQSGRDASTRLDGSSEDAAKGSVDSATTRSDAAVSGADASSDSGATGATPTSCSKPNMWKAGDTNASIMIGGTRRTYILHVPSSYKGDKPVPLLIDSHPMIFGTASSQRRSSGYAEIADREGFIVAYGDGIDNAWNLGPCCTRSRDVDDFGFITQLVQKLKDEGCIDSRRVYAAGYSNGGGLAHYLACKHADIFAAVSPAAFDLIQEVPCMPSRPISVIMHRGTADNVVPTRPHESTPPTPYPLEPINFLGAEGTFKKWAELNGCTGEPTAAGTNCQTYPQCGDGVEVTLCLTPRGGHVTGDATYGWEHMKKHTLP